MLISCICLTKDYFQFHKSPFCEKESWNDFILTSPKVRTIRNTISRLVSSFTANSPTCCEDDSVFVRLNYFSLCWSWQVKSSFKSQTFVEKSPEAEASECREELQSLNIQNKAVTRSLLWLINHQWLLIKLIKQPEMKLLITVGSQQFTVTVFMSQCVMMVTYYTVGTIIKPVSF